MVPIAETQSQRGVRRWRDRKRYLWLLGLILPTPLLVAVAFAWLFGKLDWTAATPVLWWIGPILLYVLLPILDTCFGHDGDNPPEEVIKHLENDKYYRYCTYAVIPFQLTSLFVACYLWSAGDLSWLGIAGGLGLISKIGVTVTVGIVGGVGINTAHEMGHKRENLERWLSKVTLAQTLYGHFYIEHNRGHHVRVSTPEDPASARFGESFWMFLPRSVFGSIKSSWGLEKARMRRIEKSAWSIQNDVLNAWIMSIVLFGALTAAFGWRVLPFLLIQAVYGASLLGVGELPRALRFAAAEDGIWALRTLRARAQLELRPHCHQRLPLPSAAAQRPPRQSRSALPDAAQYGRCPQSAQRIRQPYQPDLLPPGLAKVDGPPRHRALSG